MKKKIIGVLSLVLLSGTMMFGVAPMDTDAANSVCCKYWGQKCQHVVTGNVSFTSYPCADNYKHRREVRTITECKCCYQVLNNSYERYDESHTTPNNNACRCGFVPPRR